ncbi:hypothetical protein M0805_004951 [Coniferiporia weirii]|nr:hypothetical protein M0805_004951 [Coniferiporia weirii]
MSDAPPPIPAEFQVYDSYVTDPTFQRKFSIVWASVAAAAIFFSLPHLFRSLRKGYLRTSIVGFSEDLNGRAYEPVAADVRAKSKTGAKKVTRKDRLTVKLVGLVSAVRSLALLSVPQMGLDLGQIVLVIAYYVTLLLCITMHSELVDNPNRAGFMAIAQLPVVFLLATKNSPLSLLLGAGHGWEKLNFLHRWSGRGMFLSAVVHGSLWIRNHLQYDIQILGAQKETSGVACLALLGIITLSSLKVVRAYAYQVFFVVHILAVVAFFITLCYHTIYAVPYIFPPLAFYGLDLLLRLFRFRVKDATLIAPDNQMTIVRVQDCDNGWAPGQHVRMRVLFANRVFESHPLTIMSAPPRTTCLSDRTLLFGARVRGDWTRALNAYAHANALPAFTAVGTSEKPSANDGSDSEKEPISLVQTPGAGVEMKGLYESEKPGWTALTGAPVQVMLDGPYGGCSVDLGDYARVLLVAGGAGVTFTLGLLDDIVGRCMRLGRPNGERTRRIEFVWCIQSFDYIHWVAPLLAEIAQRANAEDSTLDLHISIFVTCLCDPSAVPPIPNCDVLIERPCVAGLADALARTGSAAECCETGAAGVEKLCGCCQTAGVDGGADRCTCGENDVKIDAVVNAGAGVGADADGGGFAVCAAGPEGMAREAKNAVARLALAHAHRLGRVACHAEVYTL